MSNIQSVSVASSFSASSLDAASTDSDALDPRFIEELQGALEQQDPGPAAPTATTDQASQEPDSSSQAVVPDLQNLPLMPWMSIAMPANFAPQDSAAIRPDGASQASDAVTDVRMSVSVRGGGVPEALPLLAGADSQTGSLAPATQALIPDTPVPSSDRVASGSKDSQRPLPELMPSEDLVGTQPMQASSTGSSMPSARTALDEAIKNPGQIGRAHV